MNFYSGKGVVRGRRGQQLGFALMRHRARLAAPAIAPLLVLRPRRVLRWRLRKYTRLRGHDAVPATQPWYAAAVIPGSVPHVSTIHVVREDELPNNYYGISSNILQKGSFFIFYVKINCSKVYFSELLGTTPCNPAHAPNGSEPPSRLWNRRFRSTKTQKPIPAARLGSRAHTT